MVEGVLAGLAGGAKERGEVADRMVGVDGLAGAGEQVPTLQLRPVVVSMIR